MAVSTISILTPSLNQVAFLPQAIQSVREQRDPAYEHLIFDGGSNDGTVEYLTSVADAAIRWHSAPDSGQADALNAALAAASGEIIGWVNADDACLPGAFAAVRKAFALHPDCDVVYGDYDQIGPAGERLRTVRTREAGVESLVCFWRGMASIGQPAVFWRRRLSAELGGFDANLRYTMDWDYWTRARARAAFVHIDRSLALFRVHGYAKTADDLATFAEQLALAERSLPLLPPAARPQALQELAARRRELDGQRTALQRVCSAVAARIERLERPAPRIGLYGMGANGMRLLRRLSSAELGLRCDPAPLDDGAGRSPRAPRETRRPSAAELRSFDLIVVTPWADDSICAALRRAGLSEPSQFVRWSRLAMSAQRTDDRSHALPTGWGGC